MKGCNFDLPSPPSRRQDLETEFSQVTSDLINHLNTSKIVGQQSSVNFLVCDLPGG